MGYRQAGFVVTGWELHPRQCGYPAGVLIEGDATQALADLAYLRKFDLIHASPPCQPYTRASHLRTAQGKESLKADLVGLTHDALVASGVPYVIENVPGAPMRTDLTMCGSFFPELSVGEGKARRWLQRHRIFEIGNWSVRTPFQPPCRHTSGRKLKQISHHRPVGVYHKLDDAIPHGGQTAKTLAEARQVMGIDWMSFDALAEAIPPAYTRYIATSYLRSISQPSFSRSDSPGMSNH